MADYKSKLFQYINSNESFSPITQVDRPSNRPKPELPLVDQFLQQRYQDQGIDLTTFQPDPVASAPTESQLDQDTWDLLKEKNKLIAAGTSVQEQADELKNSGTLSLEDERRLEETKATVASQLAQAEAEERQLILAGAYGNQITKKLMQEQFGDEAIIPGLSPEEAQMVNRAIGRASSSSRAASTAELMAVADLITESQLPDEEKAERLDFIADRVAVRDQVMLGLNNIVQDRKALESLSKMSDLDLLGNQAEFVQTELHLNLAADPFSRTSFALGDMLDSGIEEITGSPLPPSMAHLFQNEEGTGLLDQVTINPDLINSPQWLQRASDVAAAVGINTSSMIDMVQRGIEYSNLRTEIWDGALDQTSYQPQSEQMAMAIFQAALAVVGDEQLASQFAESKDLHMLIAAQSQGMVGRDYGGNKHGIGGLTDQGYQIAGYDYEEIRGDAAGELTALITYITQRFGTPVEAINYFKSTGNWGD